MHFSPNPIAATSLTFPGSVGCLVALVLVAVRTFASSRGRCGGFLVLACSGARTWRRGRPRRSAAPGYGDIVAWLRLTRREVMFAPNRRVGVPALTAPSHGPADHSADDAADAVGAVSPEVEAKDAERVSSSPPRLSLALERPVPAGTPRMTNGRTDAMPTGVRTSKLQTTRPIESFPGVVNDRFACSGYRPRRLSAT